jgi:hypothetical protein
MQAKGFTHMSFELNEKIRKDYEACLDTVLNGAEKVIAFINKVAGCNPVPTSPIVSAVETIAGKAIDTVAGPVAGSVIKTVMKEGSKMLNFEPPKAPRKKYLDPIEQDLRLIDWNDAKQLVERTLNSVTDIRKEIESSTLPDDQQYELEMKLYKIQTELHDFLRKL